MTKPVYFVLAAALAVSLSNLLAQNAPQNTGPDQGLDFYVPAYTGPDAGLGRRTIGHVDITFCASQPRQASKGCKVAKPSFTIQLPSTIHGEIQETWYNMINASNGIRGDIRADVESARSIKITYASTSVDQTETLRIYFMLIQ